MSEPRPERVGLDVRTVDPTRKKRHRLSLKDKIRLKPKPINMHTWQVDPSRFFT